MRNAEYNLHHSLFVCSRQNWQLLLSLRLDEGVTLLKQTQVPSFEEILESQGKDLIVDETVEGMLTTKLTVQPIFFSLLHD